jgi:Response regulators consisting of a CheY-like receiver domain and a winged-helix DNA-binding domain
MDKTKVLLVEDEPKLAASVKEWLEEHDFTVEVAPDGAVARYLVQEKTYDLVLLDLNLPFVNGFDVCQTIRTEQPDLPIIMVSALGSVEQKLTGFDAGADDYLVKPFDFRELLARMRILLKKTQPARHPRHWTKPCRWPTWSSTPVTKLFSIGEANRTDG